jgi:hypothetical protein
MADTQKDGSLNALASAAGVPAQEPVEQIKQGLTQIVLEPAPSKTPSVTTHEHEGEQDDGHSSYTASSVEPSQRSVNAPLWTHRVSASFNAMAEQIAAASQAISLIPPLPDAVYADLSKRMDDIEQTQKHIESEFALLKDAISKITEGPEKFQKALDEHIAASKLE